MNIACWKCGWQNHVSWRIFDYQPYQIDGEVFACTKCGAWYVLDPQVSRQPTPQELRAIRANAKWRCDHRPYHRPRRKKTALPGKE